MRRRWRRPGFGNLGSAVVNAFPEVFGSRKRIAFFAVIVALVGGVTIWHSLGSTTMKSIAERSVADLKAVYVTKGPNVFPLEREKWEGLLRGLAAAPGTRNTGGKGSGWGHWCASSSIGAKRRSTGCGCRSARASGTGSSSTWRNPWAAGRSTTRAATRGMRCSVGSWLIRRASRGSRTRSAAPAVRRGAASPHLIC